MTPIQHNHQRLIGTALLVLIIAAVALFLISNATEESSYNIISSTENSVELSYEPIVEAMPEGDIEVVPEITEALVNTETVPDSQPKTSDLNIDATQNVGVNDNVPQAVEEVNITVKQKKTDSLVSIEKQLSESNPETTIANNVDSWLLQLASFSVYENALNLDKKLKEADYKTYIDPVKTKAGKSIYRLRLGPNKDKAFLEKLAKNLKKDFKIDAQLLKQIK